MEVNFKKCWGIFISLIELHTYFIRINCDGLPGLENEGYAEPTGYKICLKSSKSSIGDDDANYFQKIRS
jgi:hypothetical protein